MHLRTRGTVALLLACLLAPAASVAQKLYAASVRNIAEGGVDTIGGSLYAVTLATGSATFLAPIRVNASLPLGVTGLASHPATGVFYGITSPMSRSNPLSLVSIDPATGNASIVGPLSAAGSDIAFSRAGILYIWLPGTSQLGAVNTETGAVTPIGQPRAAGPPAGLAINESNSAYVTPSGATGTLDMVDIATGAVTAGPQMTGAPFESSINSMTFTPSGMLLAVNSNGGSPAATRLVAINAASGAVANVGNLPDDIDALTFAGSTREAAVPTDWRSIALLSLLGIGITIGIVAWAIGRRAK